MSCGTVLWALISIASLTLWWCQNLTGAMSLACFHLMCLGVLVCRLLDVPWFWWICCGRSPRCRLYHIRRECGKRVKTNRVYCLKRQLTKPALFRASTPTSLLFMNRFILFIHTIQSFTLLLYTKFPLSQTFYLALYFYKINQYWIELKHWVILSTIHSFQNQHYRNIFRHIC